MNAHSQGVEIGRVVVADRARGTAGIRARGLHAAPTHWLLAQAWLAPHSTPHPPQLWASVRRSTQVPSQQARLPAGSQNEPETAHAAPLDVELPLEVGMVVEPLLAEVVLLELRRVLLAPLELLVSEAVLPDEVEA